MPKSEANTRALCPFYKTQGAVTVVCEAPFDGAVLSIRFESAETRKIQLGIFCQAQYKRCEIYRMIMHDKYPERED